MEFFNAGATPTSLTPWLNRRSTWKPPAGHSSPETPPHLLLHELRPTSAAGLRRRALCAGLLFNPKLGEDLLRPLVLFGTIVYAAAHPFGPDPARRRPSAAAPRRAPLRCALGPAGSILGRVASCACAQTPFPAEPSVGTARTPPAGDVPPRRAASTPCALLCPTAAPRYPPQWITHAAVYLPGQTTAQTDP